MPPNRMQIHGLRQARKQYSTELDIAAFFPDTDISQPAIVGDLNQADIAKFHSAFC